MKTAKRLAALLLISLLLCCGGVSAYAHDVPDLTRQGSILVLNQQIKPRLHNERDMSLAVDILGYAGLVFRVIGKLPGKLRGLELIKAAHAAGKAGGGHKAVISVILPDVAHTVYG